MLSFIAELKENTPDGGFAAINLITITEPVVERGSSNCAKGQTGVLCARCEDGWSRRGSLDMCEKCPADTEHAMLMTVVTVVGLLLLLVCVIALDLKFGWTQQRGGGSLNQWSTRCNK